MLLTSCGSVSRQVTKEPPCRVWSAPTAPVAVDGDIYACAVDGKMFVCLSPQFAADVTVYSERMERFHQAVLKCNIEEVNIGGGDELEKVDWKKVNKEIGKIRG